MIQIDGLNKSYGKKNEVEVLYYFQYIEQFYVSFSKFFVLVSYKMQNSKLFDINSPLLCGIISEKDIITERNIKSTRDNQLNLF